MQDLGAVREHVVRAQDRAEPRRVGEEEEVPTARGGDGPVGELLGERHDVDIKRMLEVDAPVARVRADRLGQAAMARTLRRAARQCLAQAREGAVRLAVVVELVGEHTREAFVGQR